MDLPEEPHFVAVATSLSIAPADLQVRPLDLLLDAAGEDSFPASDPVAFIVRRN
ncbi:MAG: hypothetical protein AB1942_16010 [Pseudomonadota bacterium]